MFDDSEGVQIVIEAATMSAHQFIEFMFTGMAEWRMANVMNERQSLHKRRVQSQCIRNSTGDLRDFDRVRQAIAKMIGETHGKNLGLGFQAAKGARVNNTIAVANIIVAVGMRRLNTATAARILDVHRPWRAARRVVLGIDGTLRRVRGRESFAHLTILEGWPGFHTMMKSALKFISGLWRKATTPHIGFVRFSSARLDYPDLVLRHAGEVLVAALACFFKFLESLVVLLQILKTHR